MSGRTGIMYLLLNNFKNSVPIFDVISPAPKKYKSMADRPITDVEVIEQIRSSLPIASLEKAGLAAKCQGKSEYYLQIGESVDVYLDYGIYIFVSEQIEGSSFLFQKAHHTYNLKILLDPANVHNRYFKIEQLADGDKFIRVTNLINNNQRFSINRL